MIKSMTGFASLTHDGELVTVNVTARSVNHRYLDVQIRVPHRLQALEHGIRERVQRQIARGRVDLNVTTKFNNRPQAVVDVDEKLLTALVAAAARPEVAAASSGKWTVGDLLRFPQVVTVSERVLDADENDRLDMDVMVAVDQAISELDAMREREGGFLRADLAERVAVFEGLVNQIDRCAAVSDDALRKRLKVRVAELAADAVADETVVAQEVVRFVARSDIHEELARLRAHIAHWEGLVARADPCGRKLDFLLQEMNREVNTIGSKADGIETSELIVAAKAELEKLREQTQNAE